VLLLPLKILVFVTEKQAKCKDHAGTVSTTKELVVQSDVMQGNMWQKGPRHHPPCLVKK